MNGLSQDEEKILLAAFEMSPEAPFAWRDAVARAGMSERERDGKDAVLALGKKGFLNGTNAPGIMVTLSSDGRMKAREILARKEQERIQRQGFQQIMPPDEAAAAVGTAEQAQEPEGDKWERLLDACYAVEPDNPHAHFNFEEVAKAAGFLSKEMAWNYFHDLNDRGKIRFVTRAEGAKVVDEFKRRQAEGKRQQASPPRKLLTREEILAMPKEPDPKKNQEAARRAAEQLPEPFGGYNPATSIGGFDPTSASIPGVDQFEDPPVANLRQGFNQRQLDFLAALYRTRRNTGTIDWQQVAVEYEIDEMLALAFLRKFKERGLLFYQENPPNVIFHEDGIILADEILQEVGDTILTHDDITPPEPDSFDENLDMHLLMSEMEEKERITKIIRSLDERQEKFLLSAYRLADKWGRFTSLRAVRAANMQDRVRGRLFRDLLALGLVEGDYDKANFTELGALVGAELSEHATPSEPKREFVLTIGHNIGIGNEMTAEVVRPAPEVTEKPGEINRGRPHWLWRVTKPTAVYFFGNVSKTIWTIIGGVGILAGGALVNKFLQSKGINLMPWK